MISNQFKKLLSITFIFGLFALYWINKDYSKNEQTKSVLHKQSFKEKIVYNSEKLKVTNEKVNRKAEIIKLKSASNKTTSVLVYDYDSIEKIREKYQDFLINHPARKTMHLSKKERKAMGLPPNAFNDQDFLYTADPVLGRPRPEVLFDLQKQLNDDLAANRVPGDGLDNQWVERGPNNVGGRTRALIFAPGSTTKVIAGGVSGGVWINNDITNAASSWTQATGVPGNLAVSCITVDPNNTNIMYIGTGEAYTGGAVVGNGVYKSIDGGNNWRLVFSSAAGVGTADMVVSITDIKAWNNPTTNQTEVFFGVDGLYLYNDFAPGSGISIGNNLIGLYRSTDGVNFARQTTASLYANSPTNTRFVAPCSFTVNSAGSLLMGTKSSNNNEGGGRVYTCTNGVNWALTRTLSGVNGRVHLVASPTTAGRVFALCENASTNLPVIKRSTDGFATVETTIALPVSIGAQPPAANDFCRGQAFYDLMIGMNPTNDNEVYIGGIEIFKTTTAFTANAAGMWTQLTDWTISPTAAGNGTANSLDGVHSDHHSIAFCASQTSRVVFGCDGGIYYTNDSGNAIGERNKDYNVTQIYKASLDQSVVNNKMLGGLQDNGSQLVTNPNPVGAGIEVYGGDGCWEFIDKQQQYMVNSYVYNTYIYTTYGGVATAYIANDNGGSDGDFVNQCGLDSNTNVLYANGTSGATYRIYRYTINPANGATVTATLNNALINAIPTYFEPSPFTADRILVGLSNGRLISMTNASGATAYAQINTPFVGAISDIKFGNTTNDIFVTMHNYGVTSVWYTSDGGVNWQNKEGNLPNIPVRCILQNPNAADEVIIGTDLGVWYTVNFSNANPTWRRANCGMKDVKVFSFDYRAADNTILAATFGRGMWTGTFWQCGVSVKTWNGTAWLPAGTPTKKDAVVFAGNYNSTASLDACSVTVNTGVNVVFNAGHSLRVGENVTVNGTGTLTINSDAALVQYTKHAVNTGNIIVKRNSAPMIRLDYTAWGSPVSGQNLLAFSPNTLTTRFYTYNNVNSGTSATAYTAVASPSTTSFALAKGYMIRVANNWSSTATAYPGQFTGVPNNGSITFAAGVGKNLLSNPYPSPINAKTFLINNPKVGALYYWSHKVAAVGGVYPTNNYASYTMLGGVASANGSAVPNDYIQVGQGFFVDVPLAQNIQFENEYRVDAASSTQFFKNSINSNIEEEKNRIWINLNGSNNDFNQILLGYMPGASNEFDQTIDAKIFDTNQTQLYSIVDNEKLVIQGKGSKYNNEDVIPLGLNVLSSGSFEINLAQFDEFFNKENILLIDKYTNTIHNLKNGSYYFMSNEGDFKDRFEIRFKKYENIQSINLDETIVLTKGSQIEIKSNTTIKSITLMDMLGKIILTKNSNSYNSIIETGLSNQSLLVKIEFINGSVVNKKVIVQ